MLLSKGEQPMGKAKVVDADGHVLEPNNLWEDYVEEREFLPLAPRFYIDEQGIQQFMLEGKPHMRGALGMGGRNAGKPVTPEIQHQRWEDQHPGGFDPHKRIADLDLEGIDIAVLFPTVGLRLCGLQDAKLASALCHAYNNWLADYCKPYADRLVGVGAIPFQDPQLAILEMHRITERLGFKGVFIRPNPLRGRNLDHPDYYPFWEAAQSLGCPIAIHEGGVMRSIPTLGADRFDNLVYRHMVSHPMEQQLACMTLILGGVLEKFPRLNIAFLEAGGGWLPYWLERMDHHHEILSWLIPDCKLRPSEYFRRQCCIGVDSDEKTIPSVMALVGEDYLLWSSDYPHFDCTFPGAVAEMRQAQVSSTALDKVLGENAIRFYNLV
jgi:predicted TIM-barrel fold metal-dependent hydrolase